MSNEKSSDSGSDSQPDSPVQTQHAEVACTHCGLPVPAGLIEVGQEQQFCCHGCRSAYQLIHNCGLEAFYDIAQRSNASVATVGDAGDGEGRDSVRYQEFDSEKFQAAFARLDDNVGEITLVVEGIHCAACVWLLEKIPQVVPGVLESQVNWSRRTVRVVWQREAVKLSKVAEVLDQLGYPPHPLRQSSVDQAQTNENRQQLVRLAIAGAAAGNNMLIAAALYLGMFETMSAEIEHFLRWASCLVGIVSLLGPGRVFLRGAWIAMRTRVPHMDLPIALGLSVGGVNGVLNTIWGSGEIYFDSLSVLVFVLLLGRYIQYRQQQAAADSIDLLYRLTPKTARRFTEGKFVPVPADLLEVDDLIEVRAGDVFPADGVIEEGQTEVDQAILTGESVPVTAKIGDLVAAGTLNAQAKVNVRVSAVGLQTRIGKVLEIVEASGRTKPAIVQLADQIGAYFVVVVIAIALVTLGAWLYVEPNVAVDRSVALLIVACPCALALATPLAISVALGRAARRHLLVKSGDVFQRLSRPGTIWLDKTGTLTLGQMQLRQWNGDDRWKPAVLAVQRHSDHPIAKAMVRSLEESAKPTPSEDAGVTSDVMASDVQQSPLGGIEGTVGRQQFVIGNRNFVESKVGVIQEQQVERLASITSILQQGASPVYIVVDGQLQSIAAVGDSVRPGVADSVAWLKNRGWQVGILSGDHQQVVDHIADQIGVQRDLAHGGLLPEEKVRQVQESGKSGTVVMVGDGVNDSAALAAASVGIAAHHSAEISLQAAPVYLGQGGLGGVLTLIRLSRGTLRNIRNNFLVSLGYNLFAVVLASIGWINPLLAALLMPVSSVTVVALSFLPVAVDSEIDNAG